ncbi:hypothetical protein [Arthrobacter sp. PAMC25284]|uniref:hypothetical protein n=1 Tax=Arthrobacter sp. PAMC25284 TaxID=2861279 RepID=UPI001C6311DE|nr:hypothetical protein [Arthrobacter sp. PAMC25284]QYF89000.1 hypothetical protein KY499_12525 [Arthrobacter sp. PAMC25284]
MGDPTLVVLHLTFFGTVAVAFVMFLGLFLVFVATLVFAGIGRLVAMVLMAIVGLFGYSPEWREEQPPRPAKPAVVARPDRKHPALSQDWTAAVALADDRAAAKAAKRTAPAVSVSVRDLPSPAAPVRDLKEVSPLVASATDRNGRPAAAPAAFGESPMPTAASVLDTGSRPCVPGRTPQTEGKPQVTFRSQTKNKAQAQGR